MLQIIHCKKRGARFGQDRLPRYIGGDKVRQFLEGLRRARGSAERRWTTWKQCGQRVIPYYFTPAELKKFLAACREEWARHEPPFRSAVWEAMPEWRGCKEEMKESWGLEAKCRETLAAMTGKVEAKDSGNPLARMYKRVKAAAAGLERMTKTLDLSLWYHRWNLVKWARPQLAESRLEARKALSDWAEWRARNNPA